MTTNHHILAAKLRRLATEIETLQQDAIHLLAKNRTGGMRALDTALSLVISCFRQVADHLKPVKFKR